ncbi:MAG: ABC transporter transmembrane domain-containing protein [Pseudomonadota bacterium]
MSRQKRKTTQSADSSSTPTRKRVRLAPLRYLVPYALRYKGRLTCALIAMLCATAATLAVPMAVRRMIDYGFGSDDSSFIDAYFGVLVLVALALAVSSALRYYFVTTLGEKVVADVRSDVFSRVMTLSPAFFDRTMSGEVVSRLTADTTQIKSAVGASVSMALRNFVLFIGALAMMVVTSPQLSALTMAIIPLLVLPLVALGRRVRKRSLAAQDTLADISAYATEAIGAVRTLQSFNAQDRSAARYRDGATSAYELFSSAVVARATLTCIVIFLTSSAIVGVLWLGAQDVISGELSAGALSQFVLYAVIAAGALGELSSVWGEVAQTAGAAERLAILAEEKPDVVETDTPTPLPAKNRGTLRLDNVSFTYPAEPTLEVLSAITFTVPTGKMIAIVGPSGSGKSTLFQLIDRSYDVASGNIIMAGVDVRDLTLADLRSNLAVVPQDITVLATSIRENIRLGRPDATDAEVCAAAEAARCLPFVNTLPDGFSTVVGERGITLSGGQRQRIAIARAILKDTPILLLDEATSSLDAESEAHIQDAIHRLMAGRTTLVIAHRLATVVEADEIIVLEHGKIVERGTHAELSANSGVYARLAELQFGKRVDASKTQAPGFAEGTPAEITLPAAQ